MPAELISLDRFRAELREGRTPSAAVYRLQVSDTLAVPGAERTLRFCFSDGSVDRVGDTIDPQGWQIDDFLRNPVVLWAHDSWSPPIGRAPNLLIEDLRLMGDVEFASADLYPFADTIFRLVKAKYLNAGSVGFLPIDYTFSRDQDREFGIDFKRQELLEYSICPVPANPNALAEARAKGIDTRPLVDWAERLLDNGGRVILPKAEVERMRKAAQEPVSRRRAGGEEWHVGAARDLPLDESDSWDGPAAAKRMLDAAGFGGDSPDSAKARRGFLIYDGAKPDLRGSYKLPFADIIGGTLKAVKGGVRAAASRLPQTDAPQSVLDDARSVIDHYEERFDMKPSKDMNEGDPSAGGYIANCGRAIDEECGLKNPEECMIHGPGLAAGKGLLAPLLRAIRSGFESLRREAGMAPDGVDPKEHMKRAREHVKAAHERLKDLIVIDPDGDEDLSDNDEAQEHVNAMHAHVKAADGYLESYRRALSMSDGTVSPGNPEAEKEARVARVQALRAIS